MNKTITTILAFLALTSACYAVSPSVTNLQATQMQDASRKVKITYTLTDPDSAYVNVSLTISTDGGATYSITPHTFTSGSDINWVRTGGSRTIYWDAKADLGGSAKWPAPLCKAKITADDTTSGVLPGEMISIPAGSFLMGNNGHEPYSYSNELPQHSVYLSAYSIGKYEVTRGQYRQFINAGGYTNSSYWSTAGWSWKVSNLRTEPAYWAATQSWGSGVFTQTDNHPVVGVSYYEAEAFCKWAGGHLPTEAQWERAARWTGSSARVYPWGDTWNNEYCNNYYDSNLAGGGYQKYQTAPVGSYSLYGSPSGCQDMAGNVWEWCKDWYLSNYYSISPSSDPQGPASGSYRVLRGGSWYGDAYFLRCAYRSNLNPYYYYYSIGFRLAR